MEKDILKKFPAYVCLSYLRWLFLIESDQYMKFYRKNRVKKLIEEEQILIKERNDILSQMEETEEGLYCKYDDAWEKASNEEDIEEEDFDNRVAQIIEEKSQELREDFDSVEEKLRIFRKKIKPILNEARKRFKLKVHGKDFKQLEPVDGGIENHLRPKFLGHKELPLFGIDPKQMPRIPFYEDAAVHQITSPYELKEITKRAEYMKGHPTRETIIQTIFTFDIRYPYPFVVDVFKDKMGKIYNAQALHIQPEGRVRLGEWQVYLQAYRLRTIQKKTYLEIARLLGANIKAPEGDQENVLDSSSEEHETNRVSFTLSEIDPKVWKYGRRVTSDTEDIVTEKELIKENIKYKINRAKELIVMAGSGGFPGFDNQTAEHQAETDV